MSIKIIKDGKKEFKTTCPYCGCEFTYELEDIHYNEVKCPCCGKDVWHNNVGIQYPFGAIPCVKEPVDIDELNRITTVSSNPCDKCSWYKSMQTRTEPYIGDTPCTWCKYGMGTCTSVSLTGSTSGK